LATLKRTAAWSLFAAGMLLSLIGLAALVIVPASTMAPLPPKETLTRLEGSIEGVSGVRASKARPALGGLTTLEGLMVVRTTQNRLQTVPLASGYFLARDLEGRCGLNASNLATTAGQRIAVLLDAQGRIVDMRIGRILCVSYDSAQREGLIGGFLRSRTFVYAPMLSGGGALMIGSACFFLGIWPFRRRPA
jgi:hypothetical protein